MADVSMDRLSIEIESTVKDSSSSINKLIQSLSDLKKEIEDVVNTSSRFGEFKKNFNIGDTFKNIAKEVNSAKKSIGTMTSTKVKAPKVETPSVQEQLSSLNVDLGTSKLVSSTKSINSEVLKYNTQLGQSVTVTKRFKDGLENAKVTVKETSNELKNGTSLWSAFTKGISGAIVKMQIVVGTVKRVIGKIADYVAEASSYEEALNLFTVTMGDNFEKASSWVEKFSNALYLDPVNVMQYMGTFNSLVSGLGIASDKAYLMSQNLTQLTYDLASFRNLNIEEAYLKLKSAISGEIEPLRNVGVALSQNTLQELANSLGIKARVAEMSEAEKAQLRYIQIMKSSSEWQTDMGRTLISPANSLRIVREQFSLLTKAIGRVFIPIVMELLPYVVVLTRWLTVLANKLAEFFGYEIADIDYSGITSGIGDIGSGIKDIGDEAGKATKKLNTMLAPFDELNVVQNKVEKAGSGVGGSGLGGDLGVPLPEYDALAGLTEQWSDKIANAERNLKKIIPIAKTLLKLFVGLWAIKKLSNFLIGLSNLKNAFKNLINPSNKTSNIFKTLVTRFKDGYNYSKYFGNTGLKAVLSGFRNILSPAQKFGLTLGGIALSFADGYKNMKQYAEGNKSLGSALAETTGVTLAAASAVGLLVSPWGALAVGIAGVTGALVGYYDGLREIQVMNKVFDGQGISIESLSGKFRDLFDNSTKYIGTINELSDKYMSAKESLDSTRDSLDKFIESLELQDGKVTKVQLDELRQKYTNLKNETNATSKATTDYYVALIKRSGEALGKTQADIAQQIADYKSLASASNQYDQEYIEKERELTLARYTGKMSAEDYNNAIKELKIEYGLLTSDVFDSKGAIDNFNKSLDTKIDYDDIETLNEQVSQTKDKYKETTDALNNFKETTTKTYEESTKGTKQIIANYEAEIAKGKELSTSQQERLDKLREKVAEEEDIYNQTIDSVDKTIEEIQGSYKGYLARIYGDLSIKGADTQKEFSGVMDTIKGQLQDLKKTDMSGFGKTLYDKMEKEILGSGNTSLIYNLRKAMEKVGVQGSNELMNALSPGDASLKKYREITGNKLIKETKGAFQDTTKSVKEPVTKNYSDIMDYSEQGISNGVKKNAPKVKEHGRNFTKPLPEGSREKLGISSPSTVYEEIGMYVDQGLVNGLTKNQKLVTNAMSNIVKTMNNTMSNINFSFNTSNFEKGLNKILSKLQTFASKFRTGVNNLMSSFTATMNGIKVGSDNKLYYTKMPNVNIPKFEEGGFPSKAQLFYARENGIPELVGEIGNQTAVANNDQITTAIENAVVRGFSRANVGNDNPVQVVVQLGNETLYSGIGKRIDNENDRYGTNYVKV